MSPPTPRVLLAVDPPVLGGALAQLLADAGAVTIDLSDAPGGASSYDAAVVTVSLPEDLDARVVIQLPDGHGNGGTALVIDGIESEPTPIEGISDLIRVLRDHGVI